MSQAPWRLIVGDGGGEEAPSPDEGALNMAADAALLESVSAGAQPVLRLYRWSPAALSFGRNQPARDLYDQEAAAELGITFVRRPTGGQTVFHDDELTYAVVAPVGMIGKPRTAYRRINEALLTGLRALGLDAAMAGYEGAARAGRPHTPAWGEACFRRPERGEVVVGGLKLVGSAQRTRDRTILQHGSILLGGSQGAAEKLLRGGIGAGARGAGWTTVVEELGRRPELKELVDALVTGFEVTLGITLARSTLTSRERAGMKALRDRFGSPDWTWRR